MNNAPNKFNDPRFAKLTGVKAESHLNAVQEVLDQISKGIKKAPNPNDTNRTMEIALLKQKKVQTLAQQIADADLNTGKERNLPALRHFIVEGLLSEFNDFPKDDLLMILCFYLTEHTAGQIQ